MKNRLTNFSILALLMFFSLTLNAQSNLLDSKDLSQTKIDAFSDAEIKSFYEKALQYNIGEEKAIQMMVDRGLSLTEVEKLKKRISALTLESNQQSTKNENMTDTKKKSTEDKISPKTKETEIKIVRDYTIFGSELFGKNSLVFEPNLRIATPSSYVLGPDDEIILNVFGYSEKRYNLEVNQEGDVYIPNVGPVYVNGLTIEQATKKITGKLSSSIYSAIKTGNTSVQLSLGKIRSIRITVIGEATKPGTYTVSSLTTLFNLLYLCGGPSDQGSYRKIELVRANKVIRVVDLYRFLLNGIQSDNVLLQEGDLIRIPYYQSRIKVSGNIRRPGLYEMSETDSLPNILGYCGGFTETAYKSMISLFRYTEKDKKVIDLNVNESRHFKPLSGDEYNVNSISDEFSNRVSVNGSVYRPGSYAVESGTTILETLEKAGGLKADAYSSRVSIFRYFNNKVPTTVAVNLDSLRQNKTDFRLVKNDSIQIHSIFDIKENQQVIIEGYVNKPCKVEWRDNLTVGDVLLMAGGINSMGDSAKIEITRLVNKKEKKKGSFKESETFIVNLSENHLESNEFILKPFDVVSVKILPGVINQRSVWVIGDVIIPGRYTLQTSNDKINDIIARTEGFRYNSDSSYVFIRRPRKSNLTNAEKESMYNKLLLFNKDSLKSVKAVKEEIQKDYDFVSIDISEAIRNSNSPDNIQLIDGDVIVVSKFSNLIRVGGEVSFPTVVPFISGKNAKYYIKQAGGIIGTGKKCRSIVIYPDGKAKAVKKYFFFRKYPKITSDAEVFVPMREKGNRTKLGVGELAIIISALGVVTNAIVAMKKN